MRLRVGLAGVTEMDLRTLPPPLLLLELLLQPGRNANATRAKQSSDFFMTTTREETEPEAAGAVDGLFGWGTLPGSESQERFHSVDQSTGTPVFRRVHLTFRFNHGRSGVCVVHANGNEF